MKGDEEEAVSERNSLINGESSPQIQSENEMLPNSVTGLQAQAQNIDNSQAQQRNEIGMKGVNYFSSTSQPESFTNTVETGFNDMAKLNGEAAGVMLFYFYTQLFYCS